MTLTIRKYLAKRLGGQPRGQGVDLLFWCPACIERHGSESNDPKLHIHIEKGLGHCFRCEFKFRTFSRLFRYINNGVLRQEEIALLTKEDVVTEGPVTRTVRKIFRPQRSRSAYLVPVVLPREAAPIYGGKSMISTRIAMRYLRKRGVPDDYVETFDIHYCASGPYGNYLVFPVIQDEEQVYFATRFAGTGRRMKSKNPPKDSSGTYVSKKTCLLNYDRCVGVKRVALVEGPFDVMAFPYALGILGKVVSCAQVRLIERLVDEGLEEVVIALDPDAAEQAHEAHEMLLGRVPTVSFLPLRGEADPWDLRDQLPKLMRNRTQPSTLSQVEAQLNRPNALRRFWRRQRAVR